VKVGGGVHGAGAGPCVHDGVVGVILGVILHVILHAILHAVLDAAHLGPMMFDRRIRNAFLCV
jgi:hypothetical protein